MTVTLSMYLEYWALQSYLDPIFTTVTLILGPYRKTLHSNLDPWRTYVKLIPWPHLEKFYTLTLTLFCSMLHSYLDPFVLNVTLISGPHHNKCFIHTWTPLYKTMWINTKVYYKNCILCTLGRTVTMCKVAFKGRCQFEELHSLYIDNNWWSTKNVQRITWCHWLRENASDELIQDRWARDTVWNQSIHSSHHRTKKFFNFSTSKTDLVKTNFVYCMPYHIKKQYLEVVF